MKPLSIRLTTVNSLVAGFSLVYAEFDGDVIPLPHYAATRHLHLARGAVRARGILETRK